MKYWVNQITTKFSLQGERQMRQFENQGKWEPENQEAAVSIKNMETSATLSPERVECFTLGKQEELTVGQGTASFKENIFVF